VQPHGQQPHGADAPLIRIVARDARGRKVMAWLVAKVRSLVRDVEGQDLLEYALLVALIAIISIVAVTAAGGRVNEIFTQIAHDI
jgi:pilus assembly protein Flp/PilA